MAISERSQIIIVWWALVFTAIYGVTLGWLLDMIPPPDADMNAQEVAAWYQKQDTEIKIGATIASYVSAFMLPFWCVIGIQVARQEKGRPIWATMAVAGGVMMSIFLVLPPLFWGVAAFSPNRDPEVTKLMHELGCLTLTTTDQYYIFNWVAIIVIAFLPQIAKHSPFPRWYGYFSAWCAMMFEAGAIAFNTKDGPFSWHGLLVFWSPLTLFGLWIAVTAYLLLTNLKLQMADAIEAEKAEAAAGTAAVPAAGS